VKSVLVFGATSAIAEQSCRIWSSEGARIYLAARDRSALAIIASDLRVRGASDVETDTFDAGETSSIDAVVDRAWQRFGSFDVILVAYGSLPDQALCTVDHDYAERAFSVNATSVIRLAGIVAQRLETQERGVLALIGSVAGDRGRASNAVYGAAKAAVAAYASALRQRLQRSNVSLVLIKPGLVDTPMTRSLAKGRVWATPERVARDIVAAVTRAAPVAYTPWFWRWIMLVIRLIPDRLFVRLRF